MLDSQSYPQLIHIFLVLSAIIISSCVHTSHNTCPCENLSLAPSTALSDLELRQCLLAELNKLANNADNSNLQQLRPQLQQRQCSLSLPSSKHLAISTEQIYEQAIKSVVVIGRRYKCNNCEDWHLCTATGFIISQSGACVTNYHVVAEPDMEIIAAMTQQREILPVSKILAADEAHDFAILQLQGSNFTPLALASQRAPVGTTVYCIGHPNDHYYSLSQGLISRYFQPPSRPPGTIHLTVTSEFAQGSSGSPLLNQYGEVVALASYTSSVYYEKNNFPYHLQMVFKHAIPIEVVLRAIGN